MQKLLNISKEVPNCGALPAEKKLTRKAQKIQFRIGGKIGEKNR